MTAIDQNRLNDFLGIMVSDLAAATSAVLVIIGHKLGLYEAMAGAGPLTAAEVAERAGCAERYVREWLNNQAAGGYVTYEPKSGKYLLPPEQAYALADSTSPVFLPPALELTASMYLDEEMALEAFRTGDGVPWHAHNERLFCGTAAFFRNGYQQHLTAEWLPSLDGVVDKLERGASVADVGCGFGHSSIIMAQSFPKSRFHGFDYHDASVSAAEELAQEAGVTDRVQFRKASAKDYPAERYDLICFFDCLHDMGDPVGAARHAREALADDGALMLVEPMAGGRIEDNLNPVGRLYYAASTTLCCAHSLSEEVGMALGAQAGEPRLSEVLGEAGFTRVRRAAETPFNLVLEARP